MYLILAWQDIQNIGLVLNQDGKVRLFATHTEAKRFAEKELTWNWKIVEV